VATVGLPIAMTNAALQKLPADPSVAPFPVLRLGVNVVGDAPISWWKQQAGTCASHSMVSDVGSCNNASDGNSFYAVFDTTGGDVRQWGVKFDSSTDNATALQAAFTWLAKGNKLSIYPSVFQARFSTAITATLSSNSSVTLVGAGADASVLGYTGSGTGITLTLQDQGSSVHLRDFSLCTTQVNTATGLNLVQSATVTVPIAPVSDVSITLRGCDGYGVTDYWATAMTVTGVSYINFAPNFFVQGLGSTNEGGVGIHFTGASSSLASVVYNFYGAIFNNLTTGTTIDQWYQGFVFSGTNWTHVGTCVSVTSGVGTDGLNIADSQCNPTLVGVQANIATVIIHDSQFILGANNTKAIYLPNTNMFALNNNVISNAASLTGLVGIRADSELIPGVISGNTYNNIAVPLEYSTNSFLDTVYGNKYVGGSGTSLTTLASATALSDMSQTQAQLPTCNASTLHREAYITNSTGNTFGASLGSSAGSQNVKAVCNAFTWSVGALQ
jgi:hypothetical protein